MSKRVRITEWKDTHGYVYECNGIMYGFSFRPPEGKVFKDDIANGLYDGYSPREREFFSMEKTGRVFYGTVEE